jgi:hypothetical protein
LLEPLNGHKSKEEGKGNNNLLESLDSNKGKERDARGEWEKNLA